MSEEIRFSDHFESKINLLADWGISISKELIIETIRSPDKVERLGEDKIVAQQGLNERLVVRVVYREFQAFILVITVYPGRRSRYEKD